MEPTATVFNIQKFSLDDGPGIRTVVFLKGCPLRCAWCANPESQRPAPQVEWDGRACHRCGACAAASDAARLVTGDDGEVRVQVDHARVAARHGQEELVGACPWRALSVAGEERAVDEVVAECLKDLPFYEQSGGGVTFSGGEALMSCDFVVAVADRLHGEGVDCAVETTGHGTAATFEKMLGAVDRVLFDVKHWDDEAHRAGTGVGLGLISENLGRALASGVDVLVRVPVIPGFNIDDVADPVAQARTADGLAAHLRRVADAAGSAVPPVQLLPFHQYGEGKYAMLGTEYGLAGAPSLHPEDVEPLAEALRERGVDARV